MALKTRSETNQIVVHCSATKANQNFTAYDIDRWHRERGFIKIGYHYVITRDGELEVGRNELEYGAHARGFNDSSIGVCLIGGIDENGTAEDNFTDEQYETLETLVKTLKSRYPDATVLGHRDLPKVRKDCPCFSVRRFLQSRDLD